MVNLPQTGDFKMVLKHHFEVRCDLPGYILTPRSTTFLDLRLF
jgi:hypothetical protein